MQARAGSGGSCPAVRGAGPHVWCPFGRRLRVDNGMATGFRGQSCQEVCPFNRKSSSAVKERAFDAPEERGHAWHALRCGTPRHTPSGSGVGQVSRSRPRRPQASLSFVSSRYRSRLGDLARIAARIVTAAVRTLTREHALAVGVVAGIQTLGSRTAPRGFPWRSSAYRTMARHAGALPLARTQRTHRGYGYGRSRGVRGAARRAHPPRAPGKDALVRRWYTNRPRGTRGQAAAADGVPAGAWPRPRPGSLPKPAAHSPAPVCETAAPRAYIGSQHSPSDHTWIQIPNPDDRAVHRSAEARRDHPRRRLPSTATGYWSGRAPCRCPRIDGATLRRSSSRKASGSVNMTKWPPPAIRTNAFRGA